MSRAVPTPTNPNADNWCPGAFRILREQNYDLYSDSLWVRIFGSSMIGYHKELTVECLATRGIRTITKDYYFTSSPDADSASVTRVHYETMSTSTTTEKQQK